MSLTVQDASSPDLELLVRYLAPVPRRKDPMVLLRLGRVGVRWVGAVSEMPGLEALPIDALWKSEVSLD